MAVHSRREEIKDANKMLAACIRGEMKPMPPSQCCIYKVPKRLRRVKEVAFVPEIVSIGPFHHGEKILQTMEEHKKWYLHAIVTRMSALSETSLEDLVIAMRELEEYARDCYAETINNLNSDEFVKMMLLDGCFILQFLYIHGDEVFSNNNDPISNSKWMVDSLVHDMILLENQIPFVVVETLFELTRDPEGRGSSLEQLVIHFLKLIVPTIGSLRCDPRTCEHLLDILCSNLLPSSPPMRMGHYPVSEFRHCVAALQEAGVKFKKNTSADGLLDIKFSAGVFEIPPFHFNALIDDVLRNLIVWEQCDRYSSGRITSYALLLDILINSQKDVKLLRQKGILENLSVDDEMIAIAINKLCEGVEVKKFHYDELCHRVNAYYRTDWNRWRAPLKRDYFNTPWAILSFSAAVVLLILTLIQTIYAILE